MPECIPVNFHKWPPWLTLPDVEVGWWEKTDLDVHYSTVPQQKYVTCQGHKYDVIPATSKQAGVPYLGEKQKSNINMYTYMPKGTVEFNPWVGKPQLEFYVHTSVLPQGETIII